VILAASRTDESSYELAKYSHGLFTYYLLEGLRQQKDAPLDKIYQWVAAQVAKEADANGWKQHPVFGSSDEASPVVLGIAPADTVGWMLLGQPIRAKRAPVSW
jgi:hypothetical protein